MKLARAIKVMSRDSRVSCLAVVRDGVSGYVELVHAGGVMQIRSGSSFRVPLPIKLNDLSGSDREIVATMATTTEWTAFREGVPLEDGEALARPKRARRTK